MCQLIASLLYRYCKLLIQEIAVKVDQGFLNAMLGLFASGQADDVQIKAAFTADCATVDSSLLADADAMLTSSTVIKNYFDELHFSPLKVYYTD